VPIANTPDRRRADRIDVNQEFADADELTYVSDVSECGLFLHTHERLPIGDELQLRFTVVLDDPLVVAVLARVVRHQSKPSGMGVEFVDLSAEAVLLLNQVVTHGKPRPSGPPIKIHVGRATTQRSMRPLQSDMGMAAVTGVIESPPRSETSGVFDRVSENGSSVQVIGLENDQVRRVLRNDLIDDPTPNPAELVEAPEVEAPEVEAPVAGEPVAQEVRALEFDLGSDGELSASADEARDERHPTPTADPDEDAHLMRFVPPKLPSASDPNE